ncbi:T9SS type A sorting domain-containing protein [Polaribacter sp.]|uniref:T9SS type A sorting domain-containing protein n=1 Tax=Polaribacter sp. TaxID=1920175 RepID=UPI003F6AE1B3
MKTRLLFAFLSFNLLQINAQCTESVGGFGNSPDGPSYHINGDVDLTLNSNNTITLQLGANFSTTPGPDVRAFLVVSDGKTDAELTTTLISNLNYIEIGLTQASGAQTLTATIPEGKDITKFDKLFFYCLQFDHFWDLGTFQKFTANTCAALNVTNFPVDKIHIYPNPGKDKIQLSNLDNLSAEIRIFTILGKQVLNQSKFSQKTIDISAFNKGVYLVKIDVDGKSKTQKLVID